MNLNQSNEFSGLPHLGGPWAPPFTSGYTIELDNQQRKHIIRVRCDNCGNNIGWPWHRALYPKDFYSRAAQHAATCPWHPHTGLTHAEWRQWQQSAIDWALSPDQYSERWRVFGIRHRRADGTGLFVWVVECPTAEWLYGRMKHRYAVFEHWEQAQVYRRYLTTELQEINRRKREEGDRT